MRWHGHRPRSRGRRERRNSTGRRRGSRRLRRGRSRSQGRVLGGDRGRSAEKGSCSFATLAPGPPSFGANAADHALPLAFDAHDRPSEIEEGRGEGCGEIEAAGVADRTAKRAEARGAQRRIDEVGRGGRPHAGRRDRIAVLRRGHAAHFARRGGRGQIATLLRGVGNHPQVTCRLVRVAVATVAV
mgnify:CR=1 FL=1